MDRGTSVPYLSRWRGKLCRVYIVRVGAIMDQAASWTCKGGGSATDMALLYSCHIFNIGLKDFPIQASL